jgi:hypothetical protein
MIINPMKILVNLEEQTDNLTTPVKTPEQLKKEEEEKKAQEDAEAAAKLEQLKNTATSMATGQLMAAGINTGMRAASAVGRGAVTAGKWIGSKAMANPTLGLGAAGLAAGAGLGYLAHKRLKEKQLREKQLKEKQQLQQEV